MKRFLVIIIATSVLFVGCKKSDRDEDTSINSSEDYALSTGLVYDVFKIIHQASNTSTGIVSTTSLDTTTVFGCDTIIVDAVSSPKTVQINFDGDCTSSNVKRNGTIDVSYNGYYDTPGTVTTVSLYNYAYNDLNFISGTMSYQYTGLTNNFPTYSITLTDIKIQNNYNQKIFYNASYILNIIEGESTPLFDDDRYIIKGSMTGRAFKGNAFNAQIIDSLSLYGNCNWVCSGNVLVKPESKNTRTLNFGGGGCDNAVSISVYDVNYEYSIP